MSTRGLRRGARVAQWSVMVAMITALVFALLGVAALGADLHACRRRREAEIRTREILRGRRMLHLLRTARPRRDARVERDAIDDDRVAIHRSAQVRLLAPPRLARGSIPPPISVALPFARLRPVRSVDDSWDDVFVEAALATARWAS